MEEVVAPARARESGMLAHSSHFRQRRIYSADPVQDVVQHQKLNGLISQLTAIDCYRLSAF